MKIQTLRPNIPKRYLLFVAGILWSFAGGMLLFKGISFIFKTFYLTGIIISLFAGALFYLLLFSKISLKHATRILGLKNDRPFIFSFFSIKSYILMGIMITSGILLRKSGIISQKYFSIIYLTMGIPLLLSSYRFYYYGINFNKIINKKKIN